MSCRLTSCRPVPAGRCMWPSLRATCRLQASSLPRAALTTCPFPASTQLRMSGKLHQSQSYKGIRQEPAGENFQESCCAQLSSIMGMLVATQVLQWKCRNGRHASQTTNCMLCRLSSCVVILLQPAALLQADQEHAEPKRSLPHWHHC